VFKGNLKDALTYVKKWESDTEKMKKEFDYNVRHTPLSYTFKQYEIEIGAPFALPCKYIIGKM